MLFVQDAIASYDEEFHRESMRYLEQSIGSAHSNAQLKQQLQNAGYQPSGNSLPTFGQWGRG